MSATRYLYLARHGLSTPEETGLAEAGRQQAGLLGQRLRGVPLTEIVYGPLPRAAETARLVAAELAEPGSESAPAFRVSEVAGDYIPYLPKRAELPAESADYLLNFLGPLSTVEEVHGRELGQRALTEFTGPVEGGQDRHQLVVTHNFLIGWVLRAAFDAPPWRWLAVNHCNAALTAIRYAPGLPASVLYCNDMSHLPAELRWTGFPPDRRG